MYCMYCGHQARVPDAVFCARCGAALEPASDAAPQPVASMAVASGTAAPTPVAEQLTTVRPLPTPADPPTPAHEQTETPVATDRGRWAHVVLWGGLFLLAAIAAGNTEARAEGLPWWGAHTFPMLGMLGDRTEAGLVTIFGLGVFVAATFLVSASPARRWISIAMVGVVALTNEAMSFNRSQYDGYGYTSENFWVVVTASAVFFTAWLLLRHRGGAAFALLPLVLAAQVFAAVTLARVADEVLPGNDLYLIYIQLQPVLIVGLFGLIAARWFRARPQLALDAGSSQRTAPVSQTYPPGYLPQNTLAVVGFILSFFVAIAGIVCSHIALSQIKRTGERGRGLAIAGLAIGYTFLALTIAFYLFLFSAVSSLN